MTPRVSRNCCAHFAAVIPLTCLCEPTLVDVTSQTPVVGDYLASHCALVRLLVPTPYHGTNRGLPSHPIPSPRRRHFCTRVCSSITSTLTLIRTRTRTDAHTNTHQWQSTGQWSCPCVKLASISAIDHRCVSRGLVAGTSGQSGGTLCSLLCHSSNPHIS